MADKINGKTPKEIKKGLECCADEGYRCTECPYEVCSDDWNAVDRDALAYIQRLERERDALLADLREANLNGECQHCIHVNDHDAPCEDVEFDCEHCNANCACKKCVDACNWQWRGVQEVAE